MNEKINAEHLERAAYVYIRQSSAHQVRHHKEGQRRQYELAERAQGLGFREVIVIDEDLGRSGSGREERPGFGRVLAGVCQGEVGAVLALEASRLARNNRDWHHLVELCALTATLIIDADGIYEPRELNDRLLLGLKGTMSEFELGLLRQRARAAFEQKVGRGHALWELPVGFIRTEEHRVEKIADRQVQEAIEGVFRKFRELGSARQATLWYWDEELMLPEVMPGTAGREIIWRRPGSHRINQILKNPCYAGALAYGRTTSKPLVREDRITGSRRHKKPVEQWKVLILDSHQGYISWEAYLLHQKMLEENTRENEGRGAAKSGPALLAGLLRCGRCGRKLHVGYSGSTGRVPRYACQGERVERGSASCLSAGGLAVDAVVVAAVLEAVQPVGIAAAFEALNRVVDNEDEKRNMLELALEKARYQARHAQRQYDATDPDNRLVAGELERRWNDALASVAEIEARLANLIARPDPLSAQQKEDFLALGDDLPAVWNHPDAPVALKKRILRTVLREIVIDNTEAPPEHVLWLHWEGGVHTQLRIPRNGKGKHRHVASRDVIQLIEELSKVFEDKIIAATLNRLGYTTGQGKSWRAHRVATLRHYHRLPNHHQRDAWLTLSDAAKALAVSNTVIRRLIMEKVLPATQPVEGAPWIIERKHLELPAVQAATEAVHERRKLPRTAPGQTQFPL